MDDSQQQGRWACVLPEMGTFEEEQILSVKVSEVRVKMKISSDELNPLAVKISQGNVEKERQRLSSRRHISKVRKWPPVLMVQRSQVI